MINRFLQQRIQQRTHIVHVHCCCVLAYSPICYKKLTDGFETERRVVITLRRYYRMRGAIWQSYDSKTLMLYVVI